MSARVAGLDALRRRLAAAAEMRGLDSPAAEAAAALSAAVEQRLREAAPESAAAIIAQASVEASNGGARFTARSPLARAVEFGAMRRPARPWLRASLDAARAPAAAAFARWLKRTLKGSRR
ncbi:MAG: hypothetical protein NW215_06465 [Hyphomicrobiales bacterium]|nr:hypothetical protein [Hyphomicrobiales bacterium]